jgi:hypothetical protein
LGGNARSEILLVSASLPLDQIGDNFGTSGPGRKGLRGGELLLNIFLMASVTLTMKRLMRLRSRTMTGLDCTPQVGQNMLE